MKLKILLLFVLLSKSLIVFGQFDDQFYQPSKELEPIAWDNYEDLYFPVNDSQDTLNVLVLNPHQKVKATIIFFHGNSGNITGNVPYMKPFVKNGFRAVLVDYRGFGKSTGTPTHKNIAKDGQQIFDDLLERDDIKNTKILLYGASIGTQIATHLAKCNQEKASGLVLEGTLASFSEIAKHFAPMMKDYIDKNFKNPYAANEDIKALNKIPKLFIHSKQDLVVPFKQAQEVFNNAPEPKQFIIFKGKHLQGMTIVPDKILKAVNKMVE